MDKVAVSWSPVSHTQPVDLPPLSVADVRLYLAELDRFADPEPSCTASFDVAEHSRSVAIADPVQRRRFVLSRYLLRHRLSRELACNPAEISFETLGHGKPVLRAPVGRLQFNLAHTGAFWLLSVGIGPLIGVDLERIRPLQDMWRLARRVFTDAEQAELAEIKDVSRQQQAFFVGWTRKEAVLKALGTGFSYPARFVQVGLHAAANTLCSTAGLPTVHVTSGITPQGLYWAVATPESVTAVQAFYLQP